MKKVYIAAYHQSKFGKLFDMTVPEIVANAVNQTCAEIGAEAARIDVGSIGATCNFSLNRQGLLAGLMAMVPGLAAKPIEAVENACASGGQAVLSVAHKLLLGLGARPQRQTRGTLCVVLEEYREERDETLQIPLPGAAKRGIVSPHCSRPQAAVRQHRSDKGAVDFQLVGGNVLEIGKRRIAGPEVVDG